jgi:hypothetical protein
MKSSIILTFLLFSISIIAKESSKVYFENNQVRVTQQTENCHDESNGTHRQYIFLQFENLSDKPITVSFKKELWYNEQCTTCGKKSDEYEMSISLDAKEKKISSCEKRERAFSVFSKMLDNTSNSVLTKFELKDIQVK